MTILYSNKYASFVPRLVASLIDWLLLTMITPLAFMYFATASNLADLTTKLITFITVVYFPWIVASVAYSVIGISKYGKTIGKAIVGLEVATDKGALLSPRMSFFREVISKSVSAGLFGAGLFAMMFTKDQRAWHDLLADTYVYKKQSRLLVGILAVIILTALYGGILYNTFTTYKANSSLQQNLETELSIPRIE
jgi:uncharacterized RDD family membrane protein YckC